MFLFLFLPKGKNIFLWIFVWICVFDFHFSFHYQNVWFCRLSMPIIFILQRAIWKFFLVWQRILSFPILIIHNAPLAYHVLRLITFSFCSPNFSSISAEPITFSIFSYLWLAFSHILRRANGHRSILILIFFSIFWVSFSRFPILFDVFFITLSIFSWFFSFLIR